MKESDHRKLISKPSLKKSFLFGVASGTAMVMFIMAARLMGNAFSLPELAADWFTAFLPPRVLDFLLLRLSFSAKPLMFVGLLLAKVVAGGVLAVIYGKVADRWPIPESGHWRRALAFGLALWVLSMIIVVPAIGGGVFAYEVPGGAVQFILISLAAFAIYGLALGYFFTGAVKEGGGSDVGSTRREFVRKAGIYAFVGLIGYLGLNFLIRNIGSQVTTSGSFRTAGVLSTEITPNDEFYVVSKNILDPTVDAERWSLDIKGLVKNPFTLTLGELGTLPTIEEFVTLECISNTVGGDLISNAMWRGVPLKLVLERAGLKPGVVDISLRAWDGYTESIPLSMAIRDEVIVAFEMNGEPLPHEHGFPARLIVPGFFGLKHVKWLTAIEPVDHDFRGFWQERGWTDVPYVKTFSRFDIPQNRSEVSAGGSVMVGGVAFAGDRGIKAVEVSADGGRTWIPADSIGEPLSPFTWVIWTREFRVPDVGPLTLTVRATDVDGSVQTNKRVDSLPDGATGRQSIELIVF